MKYFVFARWLGFCFFKREDFSHSSINWFQPYYFIGNYIRVVLRKIISILKSLRRIFILIFDVHVKINV